MKKGVKGQRSTRAPEHQSTRAPELFTAYCLLLTAYCLLLASGCAYKRVEKVEYQPVSLNLIADSLKEKSKEIRDFRGIANLHIVSAKGSQRVKEIIAINGDSHVRLESLNIMGSPSLIMVSDGSIVTAYNVHENRFYRGMASPEIIARMTGIYMSPNDIINLITGRHFAEYLHIENSGYTKGNGVYILKTELTPPAPPLTSPLSPPSKGGEGEVVKGSEGGYYDEIWIESADFSPKTVKRYDSNGKVIRFITFSDYRKIGDHLFPFKTSILLPLQKISMTIEYTDVELNAGVEESLFELIVPDDAEAVELN
jgi:outer membrane lipoprotein-sorting protein